MFTSESHCKCSIRSTVYTLWSMIYVYIYTLFEQIFLFFAIDYDERQNWLFSMRKNDVYLIWIFYWNSNVILKKKTIL